MTGVALGIGLALPVLILATQNFLIGTIATTIIAITCACIIGVIPLAGWKLGVRYTLYSEFPGSVTYNVIEFLSYGWYENITIPPPP